GGVRWHFFFSSRRRHTRLVSDWSSDVCSSDLRAPLDELDEPDERPGDALAQAERARDAADQAEQTASEQSDAESRGQSQAAQTRSEERRVGKGGRTRW